MPTRLTIDLDSLAHNHAVLRDAAAGAEVAPVLKADGYGLGAAPIAQRLWAEGAKAFFVARLAEGEALRRELPHTTIYVLDGCTPGSKARLGAADLTPVLNTLAQAAEWGDAPAALHLDTGMNRLGLSVEDGRSLAGRNISLVMSHLGNAADPADPRNAAQLDRFLEGRSLFPSAKASLAASAGVFLGTAYRFDMVRPGISLFGGGPRETPDPRFKAVARLTAPILQIRDLKAGERVGYGAMFTASRDMRIAVIEAGYADGVLRGAHEGGYAWAGGARAPFAIVSMDLIAIDITACGALRVGDEVELLGPDALLDDLAAAARSVAHECLVRLSARGERVYLEEG